MAEDVIHTLDGSESKELSHGNDQVDIDNTETSLITDEPSNQQLTDSLLIVDENDFPSSSDSDNTIHKPKTDNDTQTVLQVEEPSGALNTFGNNFVTENPEQSLKPNETEIVKNVVLEENSIQQNHFENSDFAESKPPESSDTMNLAQDHEKQEVKFEPFEKINLETELAQSDDNKQMSQENISPKSASEGMSATSETDDIKDENTENEWLDVLGNNKLTKKVIRKGLGHSSRPIPGDVVEIRYEGKLSDGTVVDHNEQLEFILSDEDVIQALDLVVALMEDKEIASVYTDARYAYGVFGRPDFKPPIPPNSDLTYEVEILSVKKSVSVAELSPEKRILYGNKKRIQGNDLYTRGDYNASINIYKRGLKYLEGSDEQDVVSMRVKCLNNLSAAQLKVKAYNMAIQSLDVVLHYEPENVKALFRKGKCYDGLGKIEEALDCMKKASELDSTNKMVIQEIGRLRSRVAVVHQKEKEIYQRMFQQRPSQASTTGNDLSDDESSKWTIVIGSFVVAAAGVLAGLVWFKNR